MDEIILFTSTHCPTCEKAKTWLRSHGIEFREINLDLEENQDYATSLSAMGLMATPILSYDRDYIVGFSPARYAMALVDVVRKE